MVRPWNDWYHVIANTYGTWLRGDPRGWRERPHRKHVEGDYKNRPKPGTGVEELALSEHGDRGAVVYLHANAANADRWMRELNNKRQQSPRRAVGRIEFHSDSEGSP